MSVDIADWLNLHIEQAEQKLISEFAEKLRKYLGCETCTSSVKPRTCKFCCGLYPIIEEYEEMLK